MQSAQLEIQRIFDGNRIMDELFAARCNDTNDSANSKSHNLFPTLDLTLIYFLYLLQHTTPSSSRRSSPGET